jgi:hypothetical protein
MVALIGIEKGWGIIPSCLASGLSSMFADEVLALLKRKVMAMLK